MSALEAKVRELVVVFTEAERAAEKYGEQVGIVHAAIAPVVDELRQMLAVGE